MPNTRKGRVPAAYRGRPAPKPKKQYAAISAEEKALLACKWLEEKLGRDILALDLRGMSDVAEAAIIVTADNARHAQALADQLLESSKEANVEFLRMEGYRHGHWVLVDMNDLLVHVFQPEERGFFNLEGLWPKAPVLYKSEAIPEDDEDED